MMGYSSGGSGIVSVIVNYNNSAFQLLGRWNDTGSGIWSGWGGTQIVFKVSGVSYFVVVADTLDPDGTALCSCEVDIDNTSTSSTAYYFSTAGATTRGLSSVKILLPDTNEHTVIIKTNGFNANIFNQTSKAIIKQFLIPSEGGFRTWAQGAKTIQCVGDSWMAASSDWPRLMSTNNYKLFPIATGGLTCANMDTQYNFNYAGNAATTDANADAVVVSFGVNDFNAGATTAAFEVSMESLVDKIRAKQATAKIFLVRVPKNIAADKDYGQYGPNMETVVGNNSNCYYVDTTSLDATIEWADGDVNHLSANGKQTLANFVKSALEAQGV